MELVLMTAQRSGFSTYPKTFNNILSSFDKRDFKVENTRIHVSNNNTYVVFTKPNLTEHHETPRPGAYFSVCLIYQGKEPNSDIAKLHEKLKEFYEVVIVKQCNWVVNDKLQFSTFDALPNIDDYRSSFIQAISNDVVLGQNNLKDLTLGESRNKIYPEVKQKEIPTGKPLVVDNKPEIKSNQEAKSLSMAKWKNYFTTSMSIISLLAIPYLFYKNNNLQKQLKQINKEINAATDEANNAKFVEDVATNVEYSKGIAKFYLKNGIITSLNQKEKYTSSAQLISDISSYLIDKSENIKSLNISKEELEKFIRDKNQKDIKTFDEKIQKEPMSPAQIIGALGKILVYQQ